MTHTLRMIVYPFLLIYIDYATKIRVCKNEGKEPLLDALRSYRHGATNLGLQDLNFAVDGAHIQPIAAEDFNKLPGCGWLLTYTTVAAVSSV